jgi:hypothetical protein
MLNSIKAAPGHTAAGRISWLPHLNLIFSIALVILILGPPFLGYRFVLFPLMHIADVLDIFTPLVLLPIYWLLFRQNKGNPATTRESLAFLVLAGFWVLGQGMHLSANSIDNLLSLKGMESGDIYSLTYFYDETLSHYLWHFGFMGISALLIYRCWQQPLMAAKTISKSNLTGGLIYGFVFFAMVVEGTTVPLGLPFSIITTSFILAWGRGKLNRQPLILYFLIGYSLTLLLLTIWGIWHQGFPGFFESGLIPGHN